MLSVRYYGIIFWLTPQFRVQTRVIRIMRHVNLRSFTYSRPVPVKIIMINLDKFIHLIREIKITNIRPISLCQFHKTSWTGIYIFNKHPDKIKVLRNTSSTFNSEVKEFLLSYSVNEFF